MRRKVAYNRIGNVLWLSASGKEQSSGDPVASLKQSVERLAGEIARSGRLKTDITAALDARRDQVYRRSMTLGAGTFDRSLAAAERTHVGSLLKFVHAIAATGSNGSRGGGASAAHHDSLTDSIRELETHLERARLLSRDMLTQFKTCDRREAPR